MTVSRKFPHEVLAHEAVDPGDNDFHVICTLKTIYLREGEGGSRLIRQFEVILNHPMN